jgi:hypothetical protein
MDTLDPIYLGIELFDGGAPQWLMLAPSYYPVCSSLAPCQRAWGQQQNATFIY